MNSNLLNLKYILDIDRFQNIQDGISKATDMAIVTVDYKGVPITKHSNCSKFCDGIRKHPQYSSLCEKCDSRGGLEAARIQKPYIYVCHIGIVDFAIPIIVDGQFLGAVMAGQVLLKDNKKKNNLEVIVNTQNNGVNFEIEKEFRILYDQLHHMSLEKIQDVANMMMHITNYILEEAVVKTSLIELNEKSSFIQSENNMSFAEKKDINKINNRIYYYWDKPMENEEIPEQILDEQVSSKVKMKNSILKPALEYIKENYGEKITLNNMASHCNISTSYFSKLFKREIGESFTDYVNKVKIDKAKELLQTTDIPIINISLNLAFDDCGYFIKIFKKSEGVTPAVYRKNLFN
ncbi:PocR ligand-binding domain-containing protein [Clostridium grantii]|uniref:Ligand-binding sensor domain-containing protein n=1 Tax=Clostridium grantii DSM 8605 TaxID=1121316 RepID=A0A1M5QQB6_9CLOT|nr:PocR ligand-binding domain-containing protein [Clostridium grantii]SHH15930.1 Ligand-binding sensor domain-containing protein [Clostridium grantii DSM 8605]